ncbi:ATP-binding cassette domain-containing protein [Legionella bononiensis]|uniref:ABC-F family ATP-binding cassette domain-containing protein n=1 Tax=Legionella bononiensis TaxID=2793102 RepID=A0ABS1WE29_9GAMM|nr:ATP-binding cassette domain-containing protein [Legionella bononiensis]MBL7479529.1 ABC-F family ATP-binding cassette domain-containing protein [Legionella bononiensis]MBL7527597.1 ABC-F family ATP-binding cassette domain-containing protein [Legionella bononiensis]
MPKILIEAKGLSFHPPQKLKPLYSDLDLCLSDTTHFMVGDNGCGKSSLAKSLAQQSPQVSHFGIVGYLSQELNPFTGTVAEKLEVNELLKALQRCEEGGILEQDFELLENNWDIKAILEKQFEAYELPTTILNQPYTSLSGGMRTRLNLLILERQRCDFYILDEPSNHLDKTSRIWLMHWIKAHPNCLIISHDLSLLEQSQVILELNSKGIHRYQGGWEEYLASKKQQELELERKVAQTQQALAESLKAKQKNQETLQAKQNKAQKDRHQTNQSKLILDKKKATSESTGARLAGLNEKRVSEATKAYTSAKEELIEVKPQSFRVSPVAAQSKQHLILDNIILPYGHQNPINLQLAGGEHLWLSGENGSGKSTLLKIIQGTVQPLQGSVIKPKETALLDQHFSFLNQEESVLSNFSRLSPGLSEAEYRTILAQLRLRRESALQPVSTLSGGETLKLALAVLFSGLSSPPLLLLDEPDNHLDLASKALLLTALKQYQGSIVLVSHDVHFVRALNIDNEYILSNRNLKS